MSETNPAAATVPDLIRLREQLTGWIARLDEVGANASSRAAERVRADYADRLRRVNEELSAHRGEIEADLARFRAALAESEELRLRVADELDEMSLRHLIGELDEAAWNEARPALERRVADADDAVDRARAEVEHLQQLATDIAAVDDEAAAPAAEAPVEEETAYEPSPPAAPPSEAPAPAFGQEETGGARPLFDDADEFEPDLPEDPAAAAGADTPAETEAPPAPFAEAAPEPPAADAGVREAADAASADEWDPFGSEFSPDAKQGDAEEDLPWLEGIDEAARGWTPPAADEGLDFLREIEESTQGGGDAPPAADLGADDLAFLEELDRAIGSAPAAGGSGTPAPPAEPGATPPATPAAPNARAEPLLCKECGAINEPHSWYCEICGSEL